MLPLKAKNVKMRKERAKELVLALEKKKNALLQLR